MRVAYDNSMQKQVFSITEKFRALRERADLSMDELAKKMGYAGASSIQRYENPNEYKKTYIAPDLAAKLVKALVGRGTPPIEASEVLALCRPAPRPIVISSFDPDATDAETGGEEDVY